MKLRPPRDNWTAKLLNLRLPQAQLDQKMLRIRTAKGAVKQFHDQKLGLQEPTSANKY